MANYEINLTATQIEAALNKAHAPATAVDTTQNLVESGAIKSYVDTQVSAGAAITTASFAGSALEDSTDGLTATDTAVPTSRAVKDYVDSGATTVAGFGRWVVTSPTTNWVSYYANLSADSSYNYVQGGVGSVSGTTITLPAGVYLVNFSISGSTQGGNGGTFRGEIHHNNITKISYNYPYINSQNNFGSFKGQIFVSSTASQTIRAYFRETGNGSFGIASASYIEVTRLT